MCAERTLRTTNTCKENTWNREKLRDINEILKDFDEKLKYVCEILNHFDEKLRDVYEILKAN